MIFKELYKEYLPQLLYSDKEKVVNFEKNLSKPVEKFTIGEWIGLFREAHMFDVIRTRKKIERDSIFFVPGVIDTLNELRNRATHPSEERSLKRYDKKLAASFMESGILCMLQELGMKPEGEFLPSLITPSTQTYLRGLFLRVSREDVLKASRDPRIEDFRWIDTYVEIEGKRYPVKGLLSIASGVHTSKFSTYEAGRILEKLGFKVSSKTQKLVDVVAHRNT